MAVACPSCGSDNPERAKFCSECAAPLLGAEARRPRETRRTVTLLFADVSGSTALGEHLDPESLRGIMNRYFALMQQAVEAHGGTVEKFVGDAVMSVFGLPHLHEDDALRAVRAASQAREALAKLNAELEQSQSLTLSVRMGINTGEVMAGDAGAGQDFVTGDAVNTAARLEQAASPGEILLGTTTHQLVRDAVEVEAIEPLLAKGKAEPVPAFRLLGITPGAVGRQRQLDAPMVGRERELARLRDTFADAVAERSCQLFTILGPAGVGKSRLVAELLAGADATVLRGHCLPYGEGITYWPLGEALRVAASIDDEDGRETARAKLVTLAADMAEAQRAVTAVAQAIGLETGSAPQEEIFWGVRKLFEAIARRRPLIVEFDDIQWAEGAFLDLIEHLADWSHDAPILLLCPARPELLDLRPQWGGGKFNARTVLLEPLPPELSGMLVEHLLGGRSLPAGLLARIADAAEGNPLFLEEMVGMLSDEGLVDSDGDGLTERQAQILPIPPSISALLAARLDRLPAEERAVAERAAVVGRIFEHGAVAELSAEADRPQVGARLLSLVRKELVRPDGSGLGGEDAYRFRHLLIRDAAYDALPKSDRAELHERFGTWLERVTGDRLEEYEEIIGYHLEQAHDNRRQLGMLDAATTTLAERAARRLSSAGSRALYTSDSGAAIKLLERALALQREPSAGRAEALLALGDALHAAGRLPEAMATLDEALEWAGGSGDAVAEATTRTALFPVLRMLDPGSMADDLAVAARDARVLEEAGRHREAAGAYRALMLLHVDGGRIDEAGSFTELAIKQATLSGDRHLLAQVRASQAGQWAYGPLEADRAIAAIEPLAEEARSGLAQSRALYQLVELYALTGQFDAARAAAARSRSIALDMGMPLEAAATSVATGPMERLAGNVEAAEAQLRADYETLQRSGDRYWAPTVAAFLAHVLCDRGAIDEARALSAEAERTAVEDDYLSQVLWRSARARALVETDPDAALTLAEDALDRVASTDALVDHGNALLDLGEVLQRVGRRNDALDATDMAIVLFRAKGATAYVTLAEKRRHQLINEPGPL